MGWGVGWDIGSGTDPDKDSVVYSDMDSAQDADMGSDTVTGIGSEKDSKESELEARLAEGDVKREGECD